MPWLALALLLTLAALPRFYALGEGLWLDEIATLLNYVQVPLGESIATYRDTNQHLFYTLSARVTTWLFGYESWALRLPAALFGVASVAALYWFARPLVGRFEALAAAALLAFSYHPVWFSQNARGYTALLACTLVATGIFLRMMRGERTGWGAAFAYGAVMALGLYTHLSAVAVLVAHGLAWLWVVGVRRRGSGAGVRTAGAGLLAAGLLSLLFYAMVLPQVVHAMLTRPVRLSAPTEWNQPAWLVRELIWGLGRALPGGAIPLAAGAVLFAAGLGSLLRRSPLAGWLMILPGAIILGLIVGLSHNLWPRFFFFLAGFGAIILVRGIFASTGVIRRWGRPVGMGLTATLIFLSATTVPAAWGPKQDFVGAAAFVEEQAMPGDAVVTIDYTIRPYLEYLGKPWQSAESLTELLEIEEAHDRTWLLYILPVRLRAVQPELWLRLQQEYRLAGEFAGTLNGGEVVVMLRDGDVHD